MAKPKKDRVCFACGSETTEEYRHKNGTVSQVWILNYDAVDNALCRRCFNYYVRRPPKKLTVAYREAIKDRICAACGSNDPNPNGKRKMWLKNKGGDGFLCVVCYARAYLHNRNNPRRMKFIDRVVMLKENSKTGVCNFCRAVSGEIDAQRNKPCKKTGWHHEKYEKENPKAHTIEVCNRCHAQITKSWLSVGKGKT